MNRIIQLGDGANVYARYNTNLSRVAHRGISLFNDILPNLRDWQICASIDGTEEIGEYIRTGLKYNQWVENYDRAVETANKSRQVRVDFTATLPGLFEIKRIQDFAESRGTEVLAKVIFSFTPDIILSPLALPKELLHPWVDEIVNTLPNGALKDVMLQLKNRPTFAEQWPDQYEQGLIKGKQRILKLEQIRNDKLTLRDILSNRQAVLEWWDSIGS
jgi:hypothetical protein